MKTRRIKIGRVIELTPAELKELKGSISGSGSTYPIDGPCWLELDCGDGHKYRCETDKTDEQCTIYSFSVGGGHYEPFGIRCGKTTHQCSDHNVSGTSDMY